MILGSSYIGDAYTADTFMLDKICGWTRIPGLKRARGDHSCSSVVTPNGQREIVVVGGTDNDENRLNSVEIFNVDAGVWRDGEFVAFQPLSITYYMRILDIITFIKC